MTKDLVVIIILAVRKKTGKTNIVILTDSMIKHLNGYEISKKVGKWKVFVKGFGGANS